MEHDINSPENLDNSKVFENDNKMSATVASEKKGAGRFAKILIPLLILLVVAGIFFYRQRDDSSVPEGYSLVLTQLDMAALMEEGQPIIIDFGADYCPPCKQMAPTLEKMHTDYAGKAIIHYVDMELSPEIAKNYPIRVIPTQVIYNADGSPFVPDEELIGYTMYQNPEGKHALTVHEGLLTEKDFTELLEDLGVDSQ